MYFDTLYSGYAPIMPGMYPPAYSANMLPAHSALVVAQAVPVPCDPCQVEYVPIAHVHVVRKGETVYSIAMMHGLDWRELAGYNRLGNPNLIYPGEHLEIPPSHY
jgi:LysM repeat protein